MPLAARVESCEMHSDYRFGLGLDGYRPVAGARNVFERLVWSVGDLKDLSSVDVDEEEGLSVRGTFHCLPTSVVVRVCGQYCSGR